MIAHDVEGPGVGLGWTRGGAVAVRRVHRACDNQLAPPSRLARSDAAVIDLDTWWATVAATEVY